MREILFRGKRKDNGEWVYGAYFNLHHNDDRTHLHHFIIPNNTPIPKDKPIGEIQVEVIPETVGQYTGLKDKSGKKIYEGDIVKLVTVSKHRSLGVVRWTDYARYEFWHLRQDQGFQLGQRFDETVTIGNIHDNPELLIVK